MQLRHAFDWQVVSEGFVWARQRKTLDTETDWLTPGVATRGAQDVLHWTNTRNDDLNVVHQGQTELSM